MRTISVVVNTFERPGALGLVLHALAEQTDRAFEVVIAEDGSSAATASVVDRWKDVFGSRLTHVSQPHEGYRRARIVNLAALETRGEYLVFIDGDCVPRVDMVRAVRRAAVPGWFLSTKRVLLSEPFTRRAFDRELPLWRWSGADWALRGRGEVRRPGFLVSLRDRRRPWRPDQPDFSPPGNAWGCFFGLRSADFERVNGWDARFVGWGSDDVDLATRLRRIDLRCGWPGPGATLFHLWHPPGGDPTADSFKANERLARETWASERVDAVVGLRELAAGLADAQVSAKRVASSSSSREPVKR